MITSPSSGKRRYVNPDDPRFPKTVGAHIRSSSEEGAVDSQMNALSEAMESTNKQLEALTDKFNAHVYKYELMEKLVIAHFTALSTHIASMETCVNNTVGMVNQLNGDNTYSYQLPPSVPTPDWLASMASNVQRREQQRLDMVELQLTE